MQLEITFKTGSDNGSHQAPRETITCSLESLRSGIVEIGDKFEIISILNIDEDAPGSALSRRRLSYFPWEEVCEASELSKHETITEIIEAIHNNEEYTALYLDWFYSCYPRNPTYENFCELMIDIYEDWEELGTKLYAGYDALEGSELYPYVDWEDYATDFLANNSEELDYFEHDRSLVLMRVEP